MSRPRLRDLGAAPQWLLLPGAANAITDVPGLLVGHAQVQGYGTDPAAQSGVTAIIPAADWYGLKCPAAVWALNGAGEVTGAHQINEWGVLETPIFLTGTMSVGSVYDGAVAWLLDHLPDVAQGRAWVIPAVAECNDGTLNDARAYRPGREEVAAALAAASGGPVAEGCVGGGTGMSSFGFKAGIGTASRRIPGTPWHLGSLVMSNFGRRAELMIGGRRVGAAFADVPLPPWQSPWRAPTAGEDGSIITILATDAPLLHGGLLRLCKRAALGIGRTGGVAHHGSGDIMLAFSTNNRHPDGAERTVAEEIWGEALADCFTAAVEATEEAVYNSLCAAVTTTGRDGRVVHALPTDRLATG